MFLGRPEFPLSSSSRPAPGQIFRGLGRLDDVIHQPAAGSYVRIGKGRTVTLDQFLAPMLLVFRGVDLARKTISAAPSAPITAISAVGQATTRSAPNSLLHIAM
jgi:hypothetical protein